MGKKTILVGILNIVMPSPHSAARYVELLKTVRRLRRVVPIRGDYHGMLGAITTEGPEIFGQFYRFFNLDKNADWFDVSRQQRAEENDLAEIQIPDSLKPHHQAFDFVFFSKSHRLAFVARDGRDALSPRLAQRLVHNLFNTEKVQKLFGEIDVTVEPESAQLERILGMKHLRKLRIEVSPPNPDDFSEAEKEVMRRMQRERVNKQVVELTSLSPQGLEPDSQHRTLARVAQSNGRVVGHGRDESGEVVALSTDQRPMVERAEYDPSVELRSGAVSQAGSAMLDEIARRRG